MKSAAKKLKEIRKEWEKCDLCELCYSRTNVVFGEGNPEAKVLLIAESPGYQEDAEGVPFCGKSGNLLLEFYLTCTRDKRVRHIQDWNGEGADPFKTDKEKIREVLLDETFVTNVLGCRPTSQDSNLNDDWVMSCRPRLEEIVYQVDPLVIVAIGRHALRAAVGKKLGITKTMGQILFSRFAGRTTTLEYPVIPMVHPASFMHKNNSADWEPGGAVFKARDAFQRAFLLADLLAHAYYDTPLPVRQKETK